MERENISQVGEHTDDVASWLKQFKESLAKDSSDDDDSLLNEQEGNEAEIKIKTFESVNSKLVHIGLSSALFTEQWRNLFSGDPTVLMFKSKTEDAIASALNLSPIEAKVNSDCSASHLLMENCPVASNSHRIEMSMINKIPQVTLDNMQTLKHLKDKKQKYEGPSLENRPLVPVKSKAKGTNIVPFEEVAISIQVNKPFNYYIQNTMKAHIPHIQDEVKVLGGHTLDVLRDVIICPNHFVESAHYHQTIEGQKYIKDIYTSAMFFIENKFYIDTRNPSNKDYSAVIRNWAATNKRCEDMTWSTAKMETTRFQDLAIVFGRPYLYQHLGNCEHVITFINFSLINKNDIHNSAAYPMKKVPDNHVNLCIMCDFFEANWATFNNTRVHENPAYFCESCYTLYNFKDGHKIGNFTAIQIPKHDVPQKRRKTLIPYSFKVEVESKFTRKAKREYPSVSQDTSSTYDYQSSTNSPEPQASNAISPS